MPCNTNAVDMGVETLDGSRSSVTYAVQTFARRRGPVLWVGIQHLALNAVSPVYAAKRGVATSHCDWLRCMIEVTYPVAMTYDSSMP